MEHSSFWGGMLTLKAELVSDRMRSILVKLSQCPESPWITTVLEFLNSKRRNIRTGNH